MPDPVLTWLRASRNRLFSADISASLMSKILWLPCVADRISAATGRGPSVAHARPRARAVGAPARGHATPEGGNDYYTLGVSQRGTTYHLSIGIRRRSRFVTLPVVNSSRGGMDAGPVGEVAVLLTAPLKMLLVVFTFSRVLRLAGVYT